MHPNELKLLLLLLLFFFFFFTAVYVFSKSMGVTEQAHLIHFCAKNFLTVWHVFSITAFCIRLYRPV